MQAVEKGDVMWEEEVGSCPGVCAGQVPGGGGGARARESRASLELKRQK